MTWGPMQILLILVIVVILFGSKKLRNLGGDLGTAIKSFKRSMTDDDKNKKEDSDTGVGVRGANGDSNKKGE